MAVYFLSTLANENPTVLTQGGQDWSAGSFSYANANAVFSATKVISQYKGFPIHFYPIIKNK